MKGKNKTMLSSAMPVSHIPLSEAFGFCAAALAGGGGMVTAAVSQCEAGAVADKKTSLPCGGNTSLPSPGRLVFITSV